MGQDLALFVQGTDGQLWWYGAGWSSGATWKTIGTQAPEALSASSPTSTIVVVMDHNMVSVSGTSGTVWYCVADVSGWNTWNSAGTP